MGLTLSFFERVRGLHASLRRQLKVRNVVLAISQNV
jgi:hypothetical protein